MWRRYYQDKLKEMEQNKENMHPQYDIYKDYFSDEDSENSFYGNNNQDEYLYADQSSSDEGKTVKYTALRKRKREDDDGTEGQTLKKRKLDLYSHEKLEDDIIQIMEEDPVVEEPSKLSKWIEENMPYKEDTPIVKQMREDGLLEQDEKVITWTNPNLPVEDNYKLDIVMRADQSFGEDLSTEDDDTGVFIKKIQLTKASDSIPPSTKDEDNEMVDKSDSHILTKDKNRRIVIKKK